MIGGNNKERLQQEIGYLGSFISEGRSIFFELTNNSLESPDEYMDNFTIMELFNTNRDLIQLNLNVQLFYIKLASYYAITAKEKSKRKDIKVPRNAFSHDLTDLIFNKKTDYNFFIYKVSKNFKKIIYLFYTGEADQPETKAIELNIDKDIREFLDIWTKNT